MGRELGGSSLLDPNLRSNLVAEEEVVDPVSQPVLIVFDKGVFGTRKTGRHPRVAETREDKQMAATQEKRYNISLSLSGNPIS